AHAVPDPIGFELLHDGDDALPRSVLRLARVHRRAEILRPRVLEDLRVLVGALVELDGPLLGAGEIDADDAAVAVLDRLLEDDLVQVGRELPRETEDEPGLHT